MVNIFNLVSSLLRYLFITIIYMFIFGIIRMIYLDISRMNIPVQAVLPTKYPYLLVLNKKSLPFNVKEFYPLDKHDLVIGRKGCDICFEDVTLSSKHVHIWYSDNEWHLEDMKSKNGTFLNDERVTEQYFLDDGDIIKIGQIELQFCLNA